MDAFNAEAVSRFSDLDEDSLVGSFLNLRSAWLDLVNDLPDEAFQDPRVRDRLHIELVGHLAEHAIAAPARMKALKPWRWAALLVVLLALTASLPAPVSAPAQAGAPGVQFVEFYSPL